MLNTHRALIVMAPHKPATAPGPATATKHAMSRPDASFIAHLIATSGQAPQTRARRRAEPAEVTDAYRALGQWPTPPGGRLARSL